VTNFNTHALARKTDGSLWSWGARNQGQCAVPLIVAISSPAQVQSATNWKKGFSGFGLTFSGGIKILTTQNPTT
jgi:hypothetical protein